MCVGLVRPSVDIVIDGIEVDFEIFIVVGVVWLLEVDASGSWFMLSSVHLCCEELWSFPDEVFVYVLNTFDSVKCKRGSRNTPICRVLVADGSGLVSGKSRKRPRSGKIDSQIGRLNSRNA